MEISLRLETENDHRIVEELTREAFWNVYIPGCDEHLLIKNLRKTKKFMPDFDFVAEHDGKIVGNIVSMEASVRNGGREYPVLTFGPVSVLPEYQKSGVGSKLVRHTIQLAKEMGYKAIIIDGDIEYYGRFGFKVSREFRITNKEKKYPAALLVLELYPHALDGIEGVFDESAAYVIDEKELAEFEKGFPQKEKFSTESQKRFIELSNTYL